MTDLAKLVVRLEAQSAQLLTELEKANRKIDRFASATNKTLTKWAGNLVGIFSARAIVQFGDNVLKSEARLGDLAERAGQSVETLSRLGYAASQSSSDVESLSQGFNALAKSSRAARDGTGDAADAFTSLGVDVESANGQLKASDELLLELADRFSQYEDGLAKSAAAQAIFGKSGAELIPFLNKGRAGIEALTARADALGITLSSGAAKAADRFNNTMGTLGQVVRGVMGRALEQVLPLVQALADRFTTAEGAAERLDGMARVLATGLKLLISTGIIVGEIFDRVGTSIGAAVAALAKIAQGELKEASSVLLEAQADIAESGRQAAEDLANVWSEASQRMTDDLSEVVITVKKRFSEPAPEIENFIKKLEAAGKALTEQLQTPLEKFAASVALADQLLAHKIITTETYTRALAAARKELEETGATFLEVSERYRDLEQLFEDEMADGNLMPDLEGWGDELTREFDKVLEKSKDSWSVFNDEAMRNTQDILADGLRNAIHGGVKEGAKGALEAFGEMLERMAYEALAAKIANAVFGGGSTGGTGTASAGSTGSIWDTALSWLTNAFTSRDSGGRGRRGEPVMIGRRAQPEMFVPDTAGDFYPFDQWSGGGGGRGVVQNIYTDGPVTQRSARQLELEAARRQRIATSRLG